MSSFGGSRPNPIQASGVVGVGGMNGNVSMLNLEKNQSSSQQQQQQQQQASDEMKYHITFRVEKFIICVDPDSEQIYGLNPYTNEVYIFLEEEQELASNSIDAQLYGNSIFFDNSNFFRYSEPPSAGLQQSSAQASQSNIPAANSYANTTKQNANVPSPSTTLGNNFNNNTTNSNVNNSALTTSANTPAVGLSMHSQLQHPAGNGVPSALLPTDEKPKGTLRMYRKKAQEAIKNIEEITHLNKGQWMVNNERADQYRRRKLPNYLLQRTDWNHPTYICQSPLSQVFVEEKEIEILVSLARFEDQLKKAHSANNNININSHNHLHNGQAAMPQQAPQQSQAITLSIKVGLVTAADEVLKNILRTIYKDYKIKLNPTKDFTFILKMEGYREYLNGHYPMLSYDRVRMNLRAGLPLKVVLTESETQVETQKFFPPDFERLFIIINHQIKQNRVDKLGKDFSFDQNSIFRFIHNQITSSSDEKVRTLYENNNFKIIDNANLIIHKDRFNMNWPKYCANPVLLWYAPQKLPKYNPVSNYLDLIKEQKMLSDEVNNLEKKFSKYKTKYERVYNQTRGFLFCNPSYSHQTQEVDDHYDKNGLFSNATFTSIHSPTEEDQENAVSHQPRNYNQKITASQIVEEGKNMLQRNYQAFYKLKQVQCKIDPNKYLRGCEQAEKFSKRFLGEGRQSDLKLRVISKERMKEFVDKRRDLFSQKIFSEQPTNLYSGECDWLFKIKIKGIENLYRILKQADIRLKQDKRSTYNGILPPNYITKQAEWKRALEHGEKIEIPERIDGSPSPVLRLSKVIPQQFEDKSAPKKDGHHKHPPPPPPQPQRQQQQHPMYQKNKQPPQPEHEGYTPDPVPESFKFKFATDHGDKNSGYFRELHQHYDFDFPPYLIQVQVKLMYGNRALSFKKDTQKIPFSCSPRWNEWVKFPMMKISQLPLETRICFDVIIYSSSGLQTQTIASTTMYIFDQNCRFAQGLSPLNMWPFYASEDRLACMGQYYGLVDPTLKPDQRDFSKWEQFKAEEYTRLFVELDTFQKHMFWSLRDDKTMINLEFQSAKNRLEDLWVYTPQNQYLAELKDLLKKDPINRNFDMREKLILLICRNHFKSIPQALDIFLCAVDWSNPEHIRETYNLLKQWKAPPSEECITFLDAHHADEVIRLYGVERISKMADDEIKLYMIELIQALMFENNHYSAIQELLLERSLLNPFVVGHELFWSLKSQLHLKPSYERFALFLEQLLMVSGEYRTELLNEVRVNDDIKKIARQIKKSPNDEQRLIYLRELLKDLTAKYKSKNINDFTLAIDNRLQLDNFEFNKCKFMNSKKKPLWLVMLNKENQSKFMIMFKDGDDLRQDILTLQLIRIMDKIWLDNSLDLRMKPYNVVATQDQVGMLEIVGNSETTARIHKMHNERFGCLISKSIMMFLQANSANEQELKKHIENFKLSCAGYCVATYILGIGDRHSDNIMITKEGHFFHIDFGHFLGNFKKKFGINRERSPFVFTKVMEYVLLMDKNDYDEFEDKCCQAYNLIRKHGNFFVNIFRMMLSAGMPELQRESDIEYLVEMLQLNLSDQEAEQHFKKQIRKARNDNFKLFDNLIHEWVKK